jgi:hypothetical protein
MKGEVATLHQSGASVQSKYRTIRASDHSYLYSQLHHRTQDTASIMSSEDKLPTVAPRDDSCSFSYVSGDILTRFFNDSEIEELRNLFKPGELDSPSVVSVQWDGTQKEDESSWDHKRPTDRPINVTSVNSSRSKRRWVTLLTDGTWLQADIGTRRRLAAAPFSPTEEQTTPTSV